MRIYLGVILFIKKFFASFYNKLLPIKKHLAISVSKVFLNIVLVVLVCIDLVLSDIFKKAVEIKRENDLTI